MAYAAGGMPLLNKTLENNFGVHIDGNVEVDFYQFADIVDLLGGVEVDLRNDEAQWVNRETGSGLSEGTNLLNGQQALAYARIRKLADEIGAIFMVDMAHPAGLIAAGLLENPLKHAHIVTTTTHKTLRGPRGGMILMGKDFDNPWGKKTPKGEIKKMSALLDSAVFPGVQGGPLEHVIAAKAVAFGEALQPEWKEYAIQVQKNAKAMAGALMKRGYKIISDGTDNHSMLVDLRPKFPEMSGKKAERVLVEADITANKNMVPYDSRSPFLTSGLRFGTAAITTRGAKEDMMETIVELIDRVLTNADNEEEIAKVRQEVNDMMNDMPMFAW